MPASIPPITTPAPPTPPSAAAQRDTAPPTANSVAPDRVALRNDGGTILLTAGLAAAAQLVPGVVEAEGATGAATAIGIGLRAATANPVGKALLGAGSSAVGGYVESLVKDASAGQPALHAVASAGATLNAFIHSTLDIPPNGAHQ